MLFTLGTMNRIPFDLSADGILRETLSNKLCCLFHNSALPVADTYTVTEKNNNKNQSLVHTFAAGPHARHMNAVTVSTSGSDILWLASE